MRISYIAWSDASQETGVLKKMLQHRQAWEASGHETRTFLVGPSDEVCESIGPVDIETFPSRSLATRAVAVHRLVRAVLAWRPTVAYLRFGAYHPPLGHLLKRVPTVLEINTDDLAEYARVLPRYQFAYHRVTRGKLLRGARGLVCVTQELARRYATWRRPTVVVSNGIDLSTAHVPPSSANPQPSLVFIGSPQCFWNGIDKLLTLARRRPGWRFEVVGYSAAELDGAGANVHAHGHMRGVAYHRILEHADIAVGTLALHRKEMDEACPLKVREYLAGGLPTIIGYRDTDFPDPPDFLLQLPNTENSVVTRLGDIDTFVQRWRGRRVPPGRVAQLDTVAKERARLDFLRQCAGRCPSAGRAHAP